MLLGFVLYLKILRGYSVYLSVPKGERMQYNTLTFLVFFTAFLLLYLASPFKRLRKLILLAGNIIFYSYGTDYTTLIILLWTSLIIYLISFIMHWIYQGYERRTADFDRKKKQKLLSRYKMFTFPFLLIGLAAVLGVLVYTKVGGLFGWERVESLRDFTFGKLLVPLGISYYTFSGTGYLLDVYWRKAKWEKNPINIFLAISFFPSVVQGPINRWPKLFEQFNNLPGFNYDRVCFGLQRMIWGITKKLVCADRLSLFSTEIFTNLQNFAGVEVICAVLANALAIYADFSGCMDIVIGAAETMGITIDENFRQPFFAKDCAEFWRRWHITLGTWFKDYIYMPIAMWKPFMKFCGFFRKHKMKRLGTIIGTAVPLLITWFLTGLWHGTGEDYIVWGFYWGILILLETIFAPEFKKLRELLKIHPDSFGLKLFKMIKTFLFFCIGRMLTATGTIEGFFYTVQRIFADSKLWVLINENIYTHGLDRRNFHVVLITLVLMWVIDFMHERGIQIRAKIARQPLLLRWIIYLGLIVFVIIYGMYGSAFDTSNFAYGAF